MGSFVFTYLLLTKDLLIKTQHPSFCSILAMDEVSDEAYPAGVMSCVHHVCRGGGRLLSLPLQCHRVSRHHARPCHVGGTHSTLNFHHQCTV